MPPLFASYLKNMQLKPYPPHLSENHQDGVLSEPFSCQLDHPSTASGLNQLVPFWCSIGHRWVNPDVFPFSGPRYTPRYPPALMLRKLLLPGFKIPPICIVWRVSVNR